MSTAIRISIIGAGSAQFSLSLVKDICLTEGLTGSQVCFMDLNQERLDMVHKLADSPLICKPPLHKRVPPFPKLEKGNEVFQPQAEVFPAHILLI